MSTSSSEADATRGVRDAISPLFWRIRKSENEQVPRTVEYPKLNKVIANPINIAMMAVNGSFGTVRGGFSVSNSYTRRGMEARVNRWNRVPENLLTVIERLKGVRIENQDALVLFEEFKNRPATLVYFDPPYLGDRLPGYDHDEISDKYHERLLKAVINAKCMIFISAYSNDLYKDYLTRGAGWTKREFNAITKGSNGKSHQRKEIVWFNEAFREAKRTGVVPITLRKKELKNGKLNPVR